MMNGSLHYLRQIIQLGGGYSVLAIDPKKTLHVPSNPVQRPKFRGDLGDGQDTMQRMLISFSQVAVLCGARDSAEYRCIATLHKKRFNLFIQII
eukprot:CAMPEP_0203793750 /NCGR_PEP_ID=MMETSP0100_2-20121128/6050_1 /ASSEMBLY_ACC=CAM_ASM_000210 /TAXON_ID=96639 /ORGANISM=" , Strain NY0313808BC1" /LENGTH=93 /DNA_ID=CAMNT_0050697587 /DNA_START=150 /DNA_END=431 /DNA_ORIENTATION=+